MKYADNIQDIIALNPEYIGFIFWEKSSRNMTIKTLPEIPNTIKKVGVFVDATIEEIGLKIDQYQLDIIQLHGNESVGFCEALKQYNIKIIKAFSIDNYFDFSTLKEYIPHVDYFLFDTKGKLPGGNGIIFNWKILENYTFEKPFFLSGGIGKTEIDAIKSFLKTDVAKRCISIDVNSRFETRPGYKSETKLRKFKKLLYEN